MAEHEAIARDAVERAVVAGAESADAVLIESDSVEVRVHGDEIEFVKQARERTLGLRVFCKRDGGRSEAHASTADLSASALEELARHSVVLSRATAADPHAGLPAAGFEIAPPDLDLEDAGDFPYDVDARIEQAFAAERAARAVDPRIANSDGSESSSERSVIALANSEGFSGSYRSAHHALGSAPLARDDAGGMQRDFWLSRARRAADLDDPASVGERAAQRALARLGARQVPTCEVPVIFDPRMAPSLLRQLAGCAAGSAVYRGTTFLRERLGEHVASPLLTVVDDGRLSGGLGSKPFDGEGLSTRRNTLVERGVLATWLLDSYCARKLGLESTGSASRGVGGSPSPGTTNLWLEPGQGTLDDLVASTPRGLLVTGLIGMGFNPVTGDYSRGASGMWIEDGKLAHPVEEITIAGNLGDMLRDVDAVADDLLWLSSVASPSLRISRMTVAGA